VVARGDRARATLSDAPVAGFLARRRVAHLATASPDGIPHVVPVCFAAASETVYSVVDRKPKQSDDPRVLRRLANLMQNPRAALVADVYDDQDWSRLGYVLVSGHVRLIESGDEHARALRLLRERYPQYREMQLDERPVIAIDVERVVTWGDLSS
jgi:coenzyme F420-0:L-glutamate ligase / coenzyme F420-1:gamma-L-glutamate ligase